MKKDIRSMEIKLNIPEGKATLGYCTCPAGQSGYCNHIMALLYEIAEYSLKKLSFIPEEKACTSMAQR